MHQQSLCSIYNATPLQYVATTDANWPEKKDHVLNYMHTAWLSFL